MATQDDCAAPKLTRTSVLIRVDTMAALRELAQAGDRPLSREIRRALEDHVERQAAAESLEPAA